MVPMTAAKIKTRIILGTTPYTIVTDATAVAILATAPTERSNPRLKQPMSVQDRLTQGEQQQRIYWQRYPSF